MKKTKNISKKVAMTILAAALTMTQVSATVVMNPTVVMAQTLDNNPNGETTSVPVGDYMSCNAGTITENNGIINGNEGTVTENKGTVTENKTPSDDGSMPALITTNNGTVTTNNGVVTTNNSGLDNGNADDGTGVRTNNGAVTTNTNHGCIDINNGLVGLSYGKVGTNNGNELSEDGTTVVKGIIQNDGSIDDNNGLVVNNSHWLTTNNTNGVVNTNYDTIDVNYGTIVENHEGGLIGDGNYGDITTNNGTVNANKGVITNNFGDVVLARDDSDLALPIIVNQYDGAIGSDGTATVKGTITNFFGGEINGDCITVTNNFADVTDRMNERTQVTVAADGVNQYRSVSFVADTHSSASYNDQFTEKTLMNADGTESDTKYYINVTGGNGQGTITIVAAQGYRVKKNGADSGTIGDNTTAYGFTYSLVPDGNNYKLNITGYNGNSCELTPAMFGLVMQAVQNTNNGNNTGYNNRNTDKLVQPADVAYANAEIYPTNLVPASSLEKPVAPPAALGVSPEQSIINIITSTSAGGSVIILNLAQTGLSAAMVQALLARGGAEISFFYLINGVTYKMTIPAGYDLASIVEYGGGISFAKLVSVFGSTAI